MPTPSAGDLISFGSVHRCAQCYLKRLCRPMLFKLLYNVGKNKNKKITIHTLKIYGDSVLSTCEKA